MKFMFNKKIIVTSSKSMILIELSKQFCLLLLLKGLDMVTRKCLLQDLFLSQYELTDRSMNQRG